MVYNKGSYNENWKIFKLSELGTFARGVSKHRPRNDSKLFQNGKYPLVQTGDVKEANLYLSKHEQEYGDFGLKQSKLWNTGTLCITIAANIAETAILAYPMCFPDSIVGFSAYPEKSSEEFMYYIFEYIKKSIKNAVTGSIQDNINLEYLMSLEFKIPEKKYQDMIVLTLSSIDKKILINNAINDNLEQQIQLIFDYLFPDVCAGNKHMGDFIIPKRGKSLLSKNTVHGKVPVIAGGLKPSIYHNVANTVAPVVTISSSGANAGFVNIWGVPVWASDSSYIDSEMSQYVYFWYAYLKRHQNNIYNIQTGSAQPHIYPSHISSLPITDLDYKKIEKYTEIVSPIFLTITKNYVENQHLQSLRDWLLPMLMNGQATISD